MLSLVLTGDGSHTVMVDGSQVTYHSMHGAIQESQVVYIEAGLVLAHQTFGASFSVFEMGFGTGLNALMSYQYAQRNQLQIQYTSVETTPLPAEFLAAINYPTLLQVPRSTFQQMHENKFNEHNDAFAFDLQVMPIRIEDFLPTPNSCQLIYYDAFGPGHEESLWQQVQLEKMYQLLVPNGILVTFCAKGAFKRCLKSVGFHVENLPGPIGKREITRAIKRG